MKKIILLLFLGTSSLLCAQKVIVRRPNHIIFNPNLSSNIIIPSSYGDNFLSKANKGIIGLGIQLSTFEFKHFQLGMAYDFINYKGTNIALGGDINTTNITSIGLNGIYEIPINKSISILPKAGTAYTFFRQRNEGKSFGVQEGTNYALGVSVDYKLTSLFGIFIGANYVYSKMSVDTNPEYESFFNHSKQLNVNFGIKVHFRAKYSSLSPQSPNP